MSIWVLFQTLCKELHQKIDVVDEDRYDIASKVSKNDKEVSDMCQITVPVFLLHLFAVIKR